jgi:hypothetical protein
MILIVEIINVQATTKPTAKGSYIQLDVAFKRLDTGKVEGKKVMSFTNKEVYDTLSKATNGQQLAVTTEKNEKSGYWDWTKVDALGAAGATAAPSKAVGATSFASPKSTYETAEERAARQVLIVRQSSLSAAIAVLNKDKKEPAPSDIVQLADFFTRWVFQKDVELPNKVDDIGEMDDDIPY